MKDRMRGNNYRIMIEVLKFAAITFICGVMFIPFIWTVCTAFKPSAEVSGLHFWPRHPQPSNILVVLRMIPDKFTNQLLDVHLLKWIFNSVFISTWITVLQVGTCSMAAYAFSRIQWKGRDKVFLLYLATMMIPGMVLAIPQFQIMINMDLVNTYKGLIIPAAFSAFGTFMLRQFMLGIPLSYNEAAEIDGASHTHIFLDVILPLTKPGIITLAIFTFIGSYKDLLWPLIMIKDPQIRTVPIGLLSFQGQYSAQVELLLSSTVICIIPLIIMFIIFQKPLIRGINLSGGVKG